MTQSTLKTLEGKVILVTGASSGIGRAAAIELARRGAKVVASARRKAPLDALIAEITKEGHNATAVVADINVEQDVIDLVAKTVATYGRLDAAFNNAGTEGRPGPITDQTAESFAATFETNVLGVLLSMKHEARVMKGQGNGNIINISSTYGHEGAAGASIYVGSKHAVEGITKSAAIEAAAFRVRVNAVAPGPTDTAMLDRLAGAPEKKAAFYAAIPLKRAGTSEEIADAITFVASDKARFITGQIIRVNGGKTAS